MENVLSISELCTEYKSDNKNIKILDEVSIEVPKGKIIGVVGESGCGKSMTAMSIMGLLAPKIKISSGSIKLDGKELVNMDKKSLNNIRGVELSMVFQEPMTSLNPLLTVGRQLSEVLIKHKKISKADAKNKAIEMLEKVGMTDAKKRYNSYPHELSGGLRQRVMIAMALICEPKVLIADEPTTALDVTISAQILGLMKRLCEEIGTSIILISHNMGIISSLCDYVYVMYAGKVVEEASAASLFAESRHPYTKGLLRCIPNINNNEKRLYTIKGNVANLEELGNFCSFCNRCEYVNEYCKEHSPKLYEIGEKRQKVRCFLYDDRLKGIFNNER